MQANKLYNKIAIFKYCNMLGLPSCIICMISSHHQYFIKNRKNVNFGDNEAINPVTNKKVSLQELKFDQEFV